MSRTASLARAAIVLMLTVATGCDNVDWGGTDVTVVPPPPQTTEEEETATAEEVDRLPEGPVLYHVRIDSIQATMVPVAEILGDSVTPLAPGPDPDEFSRRFVAERLRDGTEFALFRRGSRVGTLAVQAASLPGAAACPALPRAVGVPELVPGAGDVGEFLALAKSYAPDVPGAALGDAPANRMRRMAPILGERALRARRAPLPNNWERATAQFVPFPLPETDEPAFAATLLLGDTLGPGLDHDGWSLLLIGEPVDPGYDTAYVRFTDYPSEGRAAPRVVDYLDWDRNGVPELLLRVYGTDDLAWYEGLGRRDGDWSVLFRDECADRRTPPPPDTTETASAGTASASRPVRRTAPATPEPTRPDPRTEIRVPAGPSGSIRSDTTGDRRRTRRRPSYPVP